MSLLLNDLLPRGPTSEGSSLWVANLPFPVDSGSPNFDAYAENSPTNHIVFRASTPFRINRIGIWSLTVTSASRPSNNWAGTRSRWSSGR